MTGFRVTDELKAGAREHLQRAGEKPEQTVERRVREELARLGCSEPSVYCARIYKMRGEDVYCGSAAWSWKFGGRTMRSGLIAEDAATRDGVVDALIERVWLMTCAAVNERAQASTGEEAAALREERSRLIALRPPRTTEAPTPAAGGSP